MKKVLFITKSMTCGGVERTLLNLIGSLDREKYSIDVLLVEKTGAFLDFVPKDVRVIEADIPQRWRTILVSDELGVKNGFISIWNNKKYLTALQFLLSSFIDRLSRRFFKKATLYNTCSKKTKLPKEKYDIVCDYHGYAHYTTCLALRFEQAKRFTWLHIENVDEAFECMRNSYPQFHGIFGVSEKCVTNFRQRFDNVKPQRIVLLYNLLMKDDIRHKSLCKPAVEYNSDGRFVLVSVGRLSTQKGFDLALEAANILRQHDRKFLWIIVGEGPERDNLENLITQYNLQDFVFLHGLDSNPYPYMAMADLYVQSSRYEGFVTTLSEAIILEIPIVSTSFSGVDQQVIEGKNGVLSAFDKDELASKIELMMDDEEFRLSCAKGCAEIKLPMDQTLETIDEYFK